MWCTFHFVVFVVLRLRFFVVRFTAHSTFQFTLNLHSSGIIWEEKRKRYKALNVKSCLALENAWQKYQTELLHGHTPPVKMHADKMEVNRVSLPLKAPKMKIVEFAHSIDPDEVVDLELPSFESTLFVF